MVFGNKVNFLATDAHGCNTDVNQAQPKPAPQDMIDFIDNITTGRIVLVAVREDGWHGMTKAAYLALESLGRADIAGMWRFGIRT